MDSDNLRSILECSGVDVWSFIDTAITVAATDSGEELKRRRDAIVERLYSAVNAPLSCRNCEVGGNRSVVTANQVKKHISPSRSPKRQPQQRRFVSSPETPQSLENDNENDNDLDPYGGLFEDEQKKILEIKEQLEEPDQSEDSLVDLLQNLEDMDITFQALTETDIGRHVNVLRKHSSNDVRKLVKLLVKKWKEIVDEWVKSNPHGETSTLMGDGDSPPLHKTTQSGHHQIPDFAYSPNPHNGSSGSDRNEGELKSKVIPRRREAPTPSPSLHTPAPSALQIRQREQRESNFDAERLSSATKRLQANYKEAENAKKQRTIQVMDIHELPKSKSKNTFFGKNKGSAGSQGRHW
ncbi:PREDICTED: probable mediator of RNA polymerase II transcription subunit 26c isoform X2 [Lupinus angustifolius]|uniref:probable mediator of RNA polymerase II transcription subunit 26c isoform X2 n=1 Tax=Lupinus angustifolius TaxID=3871 RepID=UPI00092F49DA|nr:PREDICTED: probable mediator of RNA polymerase II transcription subunit 26c isoform X2 [Lupinus angustifolius]